MLTGLGSIIGSGWLFGAWKAAKIAGPAALCAWIIGAVVILAIALTYAELGAMFPESGGMVRYARYSHGALVGFISAWANWIAIVSVIPIEAEASIQYMSTWPYEWAHNLFINGSLTPPGLFLSALLVIVYFMLNYWGVKVFARANTTITVFKFIIPGLTILGLLVSGFHSENFGTSSSFAPYGWSAVFTAVATSGIVFSFNGFQSPVNLAGEARNPSKSVPFAVIGSILLALVIYVLLQVAYIGAVNPADVAKGWSHFNFASPFADNALRGAERAANLTRRLLAFSRRQALDAKPTDASKLVAGMSDLLRRTLGEAISIETVNAAELWRISVDANQLESALLNLAVNARDAMPGGGKLTIETANCVLDALYVSRFEGLEAGPYVMIAVSDTGVGMAKDVLERAMEPFFTTKDVGHGTGLGLSQVYGFVKQSGGHVRIYSEVGEGTTVKLYLPRLAGEGACDEHPDRRPVPASRIGETILVVEDDESVRTATSDMLRELGYRVVMAEDGPSALRLVGERPEIRLLFTDVGLPGGMNGRQLADAVRTTRPELPVLFTTGYARNAIVHHGRLDPGIHLLSKPFTYAELADKLSRMLAEAPRASR
jgi:CheY-like chemotaxis protein